MKIERIVGKISSLLDKYFKGLFGDFFFLESEVRMV